MASSLHHMVRTWIDGPVFTSRLRYTMPSTDFDTPCASPAGVGGRNHPHSLLAALKTQGWEIDREVVSLLLMPPKQSSTV